LPGNLVTIELRKPDVDQRDVGPGIENKVEAGPSVGGHLDVVTIESQEYLEHLARIGVILHHDDPSWCRQGDVAI
jgi:hypothetical protein